MLRYVEKPWQKWSTAFLWLKVWFYPNNFFYFIEDYQEFNMVKSMVIRIEDFQKLGRQDLLGKVD